MHAAAILAVAVWLLLFAGYALATRAKPALALALVAALLIAQPTSGPKKRGRRKPVTEFMPAQREWALANGLAYEVPPEPEPELPL